MPINTEPYEAARQKSDLAATVLQDVGLARHVTLLDAVAKGLLIDPQIISARIIATNSSSESSPPVISVWWRRSLDGSGKPEQVEADLAMIGVKSDQQQPWLEAASLPLSLRLPKLPPSSDEGVRRGVWTFPYFSCAQMQWILSYNVAIPPQGRHEYVVVIE